MQKYTQKFIVLLRHGISTANHEGVIQGQRDYPLHQEGVQQAKTLADYWSSRNQSFELILCSPLQRAIHTAEIISACLNIPLREDTIWMERNLGRAEGHPYGLFQAQLLDQQTTPSSDEPLFETGESEGDLFTRAAKARQSLLMSDAASILVVSHGGFLSAVMRSILGISTPAGHSRPPGFRFDNTGYSELIFDQAISRWLILSHNARPHLEQVV